MGTLIESEQKLLKRVEKWLDEHEEELVQELETWVGIPSVSKASEAKEGAPFGEKCAEVLELALKRGKEFGFHTQNHNGYAGSVIYGEHQSDIGLIGHLDVVPEGDNWIYSPYQPVRRGDFLIGRGVGDNKGPSVALLYILRIFKDLNITFKHNLRIIYGLAEETGMADLRYYAKNEKVPVVSLVPDGAFPLCNGQKGGFHGTLYIPAGERLKSFKGGTAPNNVPDYAEVILKDISLSETNEKLKNISEELAGKVKAEKRSNGVIIYAKGRSGHAAHPEGSINAIWVLAEVLKESGLLSGKDKLAAEFLSVFLSDYYGVGAGVAFEDEISGKLTINGGIIKALENGLELSVDIRYPITANEENIKQGLESKITPYGVKIIDYKVGKPYYLEKDDPKAKLLTDTYNTLRNENSEPYVMGGGTYSRALPDSITFGFGFQEDTKYKPDFLPEGHGGAHSPDEAVYIPSLLEAIKIYVLSLVRLDEIV